MLFTNFSNDLLRKVRTLSYVLCFSVETFLQKCLDFDVLLHLIKLQKLLLRYATFRRCCSCHKDVNSVFFNLYKKNLRISLAENSQFVCEIIDRDLEATVLNLLKLHYLLISKESDLDLGSFKCVNLRQITSVVSAD